MVKPTRESASKEKSSFKDSLNLPHTDFPIRANHAVEDPALVERWRLENLFEESFSCNQGKEKYILHDGPPYANGHIHLGTAYNKILKDIIGKSRRMAGYHVPITPGWDCHGLPIELNVTKEFPGLSAPALKKECRAYATKWIDIQKEEFRNLGVLMNWKHPYLTMNYAYEASILEAFGQFVKKGYIEKKNKTVPWCASCQTVLAAAEIEYKERKDPSIYVLFEIPQKTVSQILPQLTGKKVSFVIWTTTPWTLPLNRAVLLKPDASYHILDINSQYIIVGEQLADAVSALLGIEKKVIQTVPASLFTDISVQHPFIDNASVPIIFSPDVSLQEGTAVVHCAPGCGPEDYEIGIKHSLEIFSPITVDGKYAKGIEPVALEGMSVADGQGWVIKKLNEKDALLYKGSIKHAYPHCWRCHKGLIFRATKQWFLDLAHDDLRKKALKAIETIQFLPKRSIGFLRATIQGRLEWCLSRQRIWGVPIPALICNNCDFTYISEALINKVAKQVAIFGIEFWDDVSIKEIQPADLQCPQCLGTQFHKETDILDVWFDSGVSHYAVLYHNPQLAFPADIYAEGVDQHRGWFQSSLLTSLVLEGTPCTRLILTHGFTVDAQGHKMSKSLGNIITPTEIIKQIGTDGLRLWVASIQYGGDAVVSKTLLNNVAEVYRKVRNTLRFLLSNLYDFDPESDEIPLDQMRLIDQYAMEQLFHINIRIQKAYEQIDTTAIFHDLADYCANDLSAIYLDIIKDRLYVEGAHSSERRSAQTACYYILDTLTRLIAPIFSFSAELVSDYYQTNKLQSIHLQPFAHLHHIWKGIVTSEEVPDAIDWYPYKAPIITFEERVNTLAATKQRNRAWEFLFAVRSAILKAIEEKREQELIKHSLEAKVILYMHFNADQKQLFTIVTNAIHVSGQTVEQFFKELLIVSQCIIVKSAENLTESAEVKGLFVRVEHADGTKCPRCWQWEETSDKQGLCARCQRILAHQ